MRNSSLASLVLVFTTATCDRPAPVEPLRPFCAVGTAVDVGSGVQPMVSWTNTCRVNEVRVEAYPVSGSGPFEGAWQVQSLSDGVVSPVQVGVPRGDGSYGPALMLIPGRTYRACLGRWNATAAETTDLECKTFTP